MKILYKPLGIMALRAVGGSDTTGDVPKPLVVWGLGDVVRKLRREQRLTLKKMMQRTKKDRGALGRLENNRPYEPATLKAVCEALGVPQSEVLSYLEQIEWFELLLTLDEGPRTRVVQLMRRLIAEAREGPNHAPAPTATPDHPQAIVEEPTQTKKSQQR